MSYKFLCIKDIYPPILKKYYEDFPESKKWEYTRQWQDINDKHLELGDFFCRNLSQIGVEAFQIFGNAEPLLKQWCFEHSLKFDSREQALFTIVKGFKPNVVFIGNPLNYSSSFIQSLKNDIKSVKVVTGHYCSPYTKADLALFRSLHFLITCCPGFQNAFKREGIEAFMLPFGFEPSLLPLIHEQNKYPKSKVFFSGSLLYHKDYHIDRMIILEEMLRAGIDVDIYAKVYIDGFFKKMLKEILYRSNDIYELKKVDLLVKKLFNRNINLSTLNLEYKKCFNREMLSRLRPPLAGLEMFKAMAKADITFNCHGAIAGDDLANMRVFEATGVGTCLLTDWKKNGRDYFEPDTEIVTYKSPEECVEKTKWLMVHEPERKKIAEAGQKRCLKDHNCQIRTLKFDEIIRKNLK